jgi:hypothetical protein
VAAEEADEEDASEEITEGHKATEEEVERVLLGGDQDAVARAGELKSIIQFIFKKRALVQKAKTRWMTYVPLVERVIIWRHALMNSLDEIYSDTSSAKRRKEKKGVDITSLRISDKEAEILMQFLVVAKGAKKALDACEGPKFPTIGGLLFWHSRLQKYLLLCAEDESLTAVIRAFARRAAENGKGKFNRQVDRAAMVGVLLDPRYRSLSFLSQGEAGKCREALQAAWEEINRVEFPSKLADGSTAPPFKKRKVSVFETDILDSLSPVKAAVKTEYERYIALDDEHRDTDVLDWWKRHESDFPALAILAKRYLAIPANSAPSERIFSKLKNTATAKRHNMSPQTLCQLLFVAAHQDSLSIV